LATSRLKVCVESVLDDALVAETSLARGGKRHNELILRRLLRYISRMLFAETGAWPAHKVLREPFTQHLGTQPHKSK
jgi:hypothetical protein